MPLAPLPKAPVRSLTGPLLAGIACTAVGVATPGYALDTYDASSGQLTIPTLKIGNETFTNVVVHVGLGNIVTPPSGSAANGPVDIFNPATNELLIQSVQVGSTTYYNPVVRVVYLVSIGGVTGADTFDAPTGRLTIPAVQYNGAIYQDVVITVKNIVSTGGGMPLHATDFYGTAGQLAIEAIQLGKTVYTNPVITPASIVSVGGQRPVETTWHSFTGYSSGPSLDAAGPIVGLVQAADGTLYGTTTNGGANSAGAVYRITPAGAESILYSFGTNAPGDGYSPESPVTIGKDGYLYGTTYRGGAVFQGCVYRIDPASGAEAVLYSFTGNGGVTNSTDGAWPAGALVQAADGNFYGTTVEGGTANLGTVFRVTPGGSETVLHSFGTGTDGASPYGGLVVGKDGNLYGTTRFGGQYGNGTVFQVTTGGVTPIYSFGGFAGDGQQPYAGLTLGSDGNFYGTTNQGGANGDGTVFRITPGGAESVLYSFQSSGYGSTSPDGGFPQGGVIEGSDHNFYGATTYGGIYDQGVVYQVTPAGAELVLHTFDGNGSVPGSIDGANPQGNLIQAADGNFYGTASLGGARQFGVVYRLTGVIGSHQAP